MRGHLAPTALLQPDESARLGTAHLYGGHAGEATVTRPDVLVRPAAATGTPLRHPAREALDAL
ncbi:hypothetical protein GCM10009530_76170 [Microbispora corallina]|uniref:Uncharacterized protein n=1 Tax=Microbispora corallina TaxID=83302 RepID=A0ABQ4GBM2_9ACTN|nr:hypothetical protein Mco01_74680 [Microbispora corallina]